jgi:hypothetical protein
LDTVVNDDRVVHIRETLRKSSNQGDSDSSKIGIIAGCVIHRAGCVIHRAGCVIHRAGCVIHRVGENAKVSLKSFVAVIYTQFDHLFQKNKINK